MKLTAAKIRALLPGPKPQKHYDGGGLHIYVTGRSKRWRLDYRYNGKPRTLSLGAFPAVGLAEARVVRDAAKAQLARGVDPVAEQHREKRENVARGDSDHWQTVAREWREKQARDGADSDTLRKHDWMIAMTLPKLGSRRINSITAPELLEVLREVEAKGHLHTAGRLRSLTGRIFRYGISTDRCERDVAADLKDALSTRPVTHHAALFRPDEVGGLMRAIRSYGGDPSTRWGLLLLCYTGLRPAEVRGLRWHEVDQDAGRIVIPAERMKGKKQKHIVPLTLAVQAVLTEARQLNGRSALILPGRSGEGMDPDGFGQALNRLGYGKGKHTPHGSRRTFSTVLHEAGWPSDWVEAQLAHKLGGVRGVYNAAQYLSGRQEMMSWYGECLDHAALGVPIDPPAWLADRAGA